MYKINPIWILLKNILRIWIKHFNVLLKHSIQKTHTPFITGYILLTTLTSITIRIYRSCVTLTNKGSKIALYKMFIPTHHRRRGIGIQVLMEKNYDIKYLSLSMENNLIWGNSLSNLFVIFSLKINWNWFFLSSTNTLYLYKVVMVVSVDMIEDRVK